MLLFTCVKLTVDKKLLILVDILVIVCYTVYNNKKLGETQCS